MGLCPLLFVLGSSVFYPFVYVKVILQNFQFGAMKDNVVSTLLTKLFELGDMYEILLCRAHVCWEVWSEISWNILYFQIIQPMIYIFKWRNRQIISDSNLRNCHTCNLLIWVSNYYGSWNSYPCCALPEFLVCKICKHSKVLL